MTKIPVIPETAPFDAMQRMWLNGFLAGLFSSESNTAIAPAAVTSPSLGPLLFLYGSQTGSSEGLANRFAKEAKKQGFETRVVGMENHATIDLTKEKRVLIVTSYLRRRRDAGQRAAVLGLSEKWNRSTPRES